MERLQCVVARQRLRMFVAFFSFLFSTRFFSNRINIPSSSLQLFVPFLVETSSFLCWWLLFLWFCYFVARRMVATHKTHKFFVFCSATKTHVNTDCIHCDCDIVIAYRFFLHSFKIGSNWWKNTKLPVFSFK